MLGLALGLAYGVLAQRSAFCLRRSMVGRWRDCLPAAGVWAMGLACAIAGTRLAVTAGLISFEEHRFLAAATCRSPPCWSAARCSARAWC